LSSGSESSTRRHFKFVDIATGVSDSGASPQSSTLDCLVVDGDGTHELAGGSGDVEIEGIFTDGLPSGLCAADEFVPGVFLPPPLSNESGVNLVL